MTKWVIKGKGLETAFELGELPIATIWFQEKGCCYVAKTVVWRDEKESSEVIWSAIRCGWASTVSFESKAFYHSLGEAVTWAENNISWYTSRVFLETGDGAGI